MMNKRWICAVSAVIVCTRSHEARPGSSFQFTSFFLSSSPMDIKTKQRWYYYIAES